MYSFAPGERPVPSPSRPGVADCHSSAAALRGQRVPLKTGAQERVWRYILTGSIAPRRYNTAQRPSPPPSPSPLPPGLSNCGLYLAARMQYNILHNIGKRLALGMVPPHSGGYRHLYWLVRPCIVK